LENIVIKQAQEVDGRIVILRAKPNQNDLPYNIPDNVTFFNHADDDFFVELISKSKNIICRGGYSSLMDLISLNRSAYLVPTPGQTEQEYLADYLTKKGLFNSCRQKNFSLKTVSTELSAISNIFPKVNHNLEYFLKNWLDNI
jgi:UDP-N-acetylglucosamine:LPS N-acetylglucosamine transferase